MPGARHKARRKKDLCEDIGDREKPEGNGGMIDNERVNGPGSCTRCRFNTSMGLRIYVLNSHENPIPADLMGTQNSPPSSHSERYSVSGQGIQSTPQKAKDLDLGVELHQHSLWTLAKKQSARLKAVIAAMRSSPGICTPSRTPPPSPLIRQTNTRLVRDINARTKFRAD